MPPTTFPPPDPTPISHGEHPHLRNDDLTGRERQRPRGFGANVGRLFLVLGLAVLVIAGLGYLKYRQVHAMIQLAASGAFIPPPVAVTTYVVHPAQWQPTLRAIGSLQAVQGVTVAADLPGIVKDILFESGKPVRKGDLLVRLVTDQEQAMLESAEANRDLMVYSLKRQKDLREKNTNSQSDLDTADANERQAEAAVANAKAAIERKTIRAGFDGVLGIRKVNIGQYLNSGDPIVALQSMDPIYVNFTLPQQNLKDFGVGSSVEIHTDSTGDQVFPGKITAINSLVDEATRNFQAQATIANREGKLRPGMFANVDVLEALDHPVLPVPSSAINYAPYGNSVFVLVKNMQPEPGDPMHPKGDPYLGVEQHFVKTGQTKGDLVAVLSGLKDGDEIVSSGRVQGAEQGCRAGQQRRLYVASPRPRTIRTRRRASQGRMQKAEPSSSIRSSASLKFCILHSDFCISI